MKSWSRGPGLLLTRTSTAIACPRGPACNQSPQGKTCPWRLRFHPGGPGQGSAGRRFTSERDQQGRGEPASKPIVNYLRPSGSDLAHSFGGGTTKWYGISTEALGHARRNRLLDHLPAGGQHLFRSDRAGKKPDARALIIHRFVPATAQNQHRNRGKPQCQFRDKRGAAQTWPIQPDYDQTQFIPESGIFQQDKSFRGIGRAFHSGKAAPQDGPAHMSLQRVVVDQQYCFHWNRNGAVYTRGMEADTFAFILRWEKAQNWLPGVSNL